MKLKWKVCGMKEPENMARVLELGPDYMGFIFYERSPRYVGNQWAGPAVDFPETTSKVGVFVNEQPETVKSLAKKYRLDYLQLHGQETPEYCRELSQAGHCLIKVLNPETIQSTGQMDAYKPWVDFFLFDTPGKQHGGSGQTFDWSLLRQYDNEVPVFLSGGISLDNIKMVSELEPLNLAALDINSRFETRPGLKDIAMLSAFKNKLAAI
jgi:phosphoribosylanthranilate isomerase